MAFEVYDNRPSQLTVPALTVDKFGRIYINVAARKHLSFNENSARFYIGYDSVNRRIGLSKPGIVKLINIRPVEFNRKHCINAKNFLQNYNIDYTETKRYIFVGKDNIGWDMFELEGYDAPDAKGQEDMINERKASI